MELKDVVLSALAELENAQQEREQISQRESFKKQAEPSKEPLQPLNQVLSSTQEDEIPEITPQRVVEQAVQIPEPVAVAPVVQVPEPKVIIQEPKIKYVSDPQELRFLQNLRERILVLFEGFQSPNNVKIEAKVDLILNFLEYTLASIDDRSDQIKENQ